MRVRITQPGATSILAVLGTLALMAGGCSLDSTEAPPFSGPSETGVSVQLTAQPDTINADGISSSVVQMVLRDAGGRPLAGRSVLFCTTTSIDPQACQPNGNGMLVPGAGSIYVGPIQTGLVMATDKDGVATVVWVSGTSPEKITISVRPHGIDAANGFLRTVDINQQ